eukprot:6606104-Alexandrium_andersonii.AAC.1
MPARMLRERRHGGDGAGRSGPVLRWRPGVERRMSFLPSLTDTRKRGEFAAKARPGIVLGLVLQRGHVWKQGRL